MKDQNIKHQWQQIVIRLKEAAKEKGISQIDIAKKTGLKAPNISRALNLKKCPTLPTLLLIANAVGVEINVNQ